MIAPTPSSWLSKLGACGSFFLLPTMLCAARPNVVFILADDLGIDWVGAYGAEQPAPQIDRLAARGVRFETAWAAPICTPSRVCLLTGLYSGRTGWTEHYDVPRWGGAGLQPARFATWPKILHDAGYATAVVGKWQVNDLRAPADIVAQHGFGRHCLWPGVEQGNPPSEARYWDAFLQIDGERRIHAGEYGPDVCQNYALNFIRENKDRPFLLYYPLIEVHSPIEPTPLNRSNPPKDGAALFADAVTYMDRHVGELCDELDRLGLTQNTIIVFMGDNGTAFAGRLHGRRVPAGKGKTSDHGVHVPLIISAPMFGPGGRVASELADYSDLFSTLLESAGVPRAGYLTDGQSLVPLLRHDPDYVPRQWIYSQRDRARVVRNQRYKLGADGSFFDLQADPDEQHPLGVGLDAGATQARSQLAEVLARLPADAPTPPFPDYTPDRIREFDKAAAARPSAAESGK